MIVVIADDITGAAEIAGIGYRYGLKITFLTGENNKISPCDLLVYATDTRSMDKNEAVKEILHVINYLKTQLGKFSLGYSLITVFESILWMILKCNE